MNYNDNWVYLNKWIEQKLEAGQLNIKAFYAEVIVSDGYFATVKLSTNEENKQPLTGIPILQSKYDHPITQPGDEGILFNVHQNIGPLLQGKKTDIFGGNYYVFLPLIKKSDYKGDPLHRLISSPTLKTFLKIGDDGVVIEATTQIEGKARTIKFEGETTIEGSTTIKGDTSITGNVKISGDTSIEGSNISIKGSAPLEIGTSKTIGYLIDAIVTELMSFKTIPAAPGSPLTGDPGFIANMAKLKGEIASILKT